MNTQSIKDKLGSKRFLAFALVLLVGTGSAAYTTIVSPTAEADVEVQKGLDFQLTDAPTQISDSNSFSMSTNAGSNFSYSYYKENLANDKTQNLVEVVILDAPQKDVQVSTLERVNFQATQKTTEDAGSTVPQGTSVNFNLSVNEKGQIDTSENGDYLFMTSAEVNSDGNKEALICIANQGITGMQFGPNEKWNAQMNIDTQNTFVQTDNLQVESYLTTVYKPDGSGDYTDIVSHCPQYASAK